MEFGRTVTGGRVSLPDQFAGMGMVEIRRLKQLEEENTKLKRLVADLSWTRRCCRMSCEKVVKPGARRDVVSVLRSAYQISKR